MNYRMERKETGAKTAENLHGVLRIRIRVKLNLQHWSFTYCPFEQLFFLLFCDVIGKPSAENRRRKEDAYHKVLHPVHIGPFFGCPLFGRRGLRFAWRYGSLTVFMMVRCRNGKGGRIMLTHGGNLSGEREGISLFVKPEYGIFSSEMQEKASSSFSVMELKTQQPSSKMFETSKRHYCIDRSCCCTTVWYFLSMLYSTVQFKEGRLAENCLKCNYSKI